MLGKVDKKLVEKADDFGVNLLGGYIRNTDKRVVIGNKLFATMNNKSRYRLRSRIVWWLHTGIMLSGWEEGNLHHINGDRIDDRLSNLTWIAHRDHSLEHNPVGRSLVQRICKQCGNTFAINAGRLREKTRGSFCTMNCYYQYPKSALTRKRQSIGLRRAYMEGKR